MQLNFIHYLIVCPLVFIAGLIDAVAGGGGLISLPAYLIAGLPVHLAMGTNKLSACVGTAASTAKYAKDKYVPLKESVFCVVFALLGSELGANLALKIDDRYFKIVMLIVIPLSAFYITRSKALIAEKSLTDLKKLLF